MHNLYRRVILLAGILASFVAHANLPYDYAPQYVKALLKQCDEQKINNADQCSQHIHSQLKFSRAEKEPKLKLEDIYYAQALIYRAATDNAPDLSTSFRYLYQWSGTAQMMMSAYNEQRNREMFIFAWAMALEAEFRKVALDKEATRKLLEPAQEGYAKAADDLTGQSFNTPLEYLFNVFFTAENNLKDFNEKNKPSKWIDLAIGKAEAEQAWARAIDYKLLVNDYSNPDAIKEIVNYAITHELYTTAINLLISDATVLDTGEDNPDSPRINAARISVDRACNIAKTPVDEAMCAYGQVLIILATGQLNAADEWLSKYFKHAKTHGAQIYQYLSPEKSIENIAYLAWKLDRSKDAATLYRLLVDTKKQLGFNEQALRKHIYNLAVYEHYAGGDALQIPEVGTFLAEQSTDTEFHHLAAAIYYERGQLNKSIEHLERIRDEDDGFRRGFFLNRLMLFKAIQGNYDFFIDNLDSDKLPHTYERALYESYLSILELMDNPDENLSLALNGQPFVIAPMWGRFVSFTESSNKENAHLIVKYPNNTNGKPGLIVDAGVNTGGITGFYPIVDSDITSDNKNSVICSRDGSCYLYELASGRLVRQWPVAEDGIDLNLMALLDNDNLLAVSGFSDQIAIWDINNGKLINSHKVISNARSYVFQVPGTDWLLLKNEKISLWNHQTGATLYTRTEDFFHSLAPNRKILLTHASPGRAPGELLITLSTTDPLKPGEWEGKNHISYFVWWNTLTDDIELASAAVKGEWQADYIAASDDIVIYQEGEAYDANNRKVFNIYNVANKSIAQCDYACFIKRTYPELSALSEAGAALIRQVRLSNNKEFAIYSTWDSAVSSISLGEHAHSMRYTQKALRPAKVVMDEKMGNIVSLNEPSKNAGSDEETLSIWSLVQGQETSRLVLDYTDSFIINGQFVYSWSGTDLTIKAQEISANTKREIELPKTEAKRYPTIAMLYPGKTQELLYSLEETFNSDASSYTYRLREVNVNLSPTESLTHFYPWRLTRDHGMDNGLLPLIVSDYSKIAYWDNGLKISALSDGKELNHWDVAANTMFAISDQRLVLLDGPSLQVLDVEQGPLWTTQAIFGEFVDASYDAQSNELIAVIDLEKKSQIVRYDMATGHQKSWFLYDGKLTSFKLQKNKQWILGTESDGGISLWEKKARHPLFKAWALNNQQWLVADQEGRFDSSAPGDLDAISWVLPDKPREALPLQAFMKEFYEPGLMQRHLAGEKFESVASVSELNRNLPRLDVTEIKQDSGKVSVTVDVDPALTNSVHDLRLFRDGQLVGYLPEEGSGEFHRSDRLARYTFNDIALAPGENKATFSVYAFNNDGVRSERATREFAITSPVAETSKRAFIIAVGVNRYQNPSFNLRYAANDALAYTSGLHKSLQLSGQFDEIIDIPLISDDASSTAAATRQNLSVVLAALAGDGNHPLINAPVDPNDLVIITFSGHGYAGKGGEFHFLLEDIGEGKDRIVTDALLQNTFTSNLLASHLRDIDAGNMLLIIDACNSAASISQDGFKPGPMGSRGLGQLAYDKAMMVITATQSDAVAMESQSLQHGMLTYALMKDGLAEGQADHLPEDGELWSRELLKYGQARVPTLYREVLHGEGATLSSGDRGLVLKAQPNAVKHARWLQQPSLFDFSRGRDTRLGQ